MQTPPPKPTPILDPHPSDTRLREFGFRIHSRPKGQVALWQRDGFLFTEEDAILLIYQESKAKVTV